MLKKYLILSLLLSCSSPFLKAQQYGLFNTKTLFDGFENPAQKTFVLDSSRKYASNFFLPNFGFNAANRGNSDFIRRAINEGTTNMNGLPLRTTEINAVYQNSNIYLLTLKIFKSYKDQKEMGFAWQIRSDAHLNYTNETLAILDDYERFQPYSNEDFTDAFNNNGYAQSYHQFSFNYRENYSKRLAFGAKVSLLSGIHYNKLSITESYFNPGSSTQPLVAALRGSYKASFLDTAELSSRDAIPTFKNPGLSLSFGTSYTSKSGVFIMANIKDLGFIKWAKSSYYNKFNNLDDPLIIDDPDMNSSGIEDRIADIATENEERKSFFSPTNAKVDFMISKAYAISIPFSYTPSLIVSKNIFYKGGDAAFVSKFKYNGLSLSVIPTYNFNNLMLMGMQGMYQTPNFEVFLGSDNLLKTVSQVNGLIKQDRSIGTGYNAASFYMGLGIKFGNTVNHPQNSSYMPGIGDERPSFFKRLFGGSKKR
ncbi:DUF5723 family protein [Pedobacter nyackensis]|uniref:DUF5723 domain-containing protein n=1 Tax=Pedobacter nyackensis TaxID=475255 RepID=A0A1W2F6H1_9SPHI|nr:DUF5723 family protein [Pedobacter nyackensis]SMD17497.1 hypothetical protein SAMN04488101_12344 [Pedobacter nyackensis]